MSTKSDKDNNYGSLREQLVAMLNQGCTRRQLIKEGFAERTVDAAIKYSRKHQPLSLDKFMGTLEAMLAEYKALKDENLRLHYLITRWECTAGKLNDEIQSVMRRNGDGEKR